MSHSKPPGEGYLKPGEGKKTKILHLPKLSESKTCHLEEKRESMYDIGGCAGDSAWDGL